MRFTRTSISGFGLVGLLVLSSTTACGSKDENIGDQSNATESPDAGGETGAVTAGGNSNSSGDAGATPSGSDGTPSGSDTTPSTQPSTPNGSPSADAGTATGPDTSNATSSTDTTSGETTAPGTGNLGQECATDSECGDGLTCVRAWGTFDLSFPGQGLCTAPCDADAVCTDIESGAFCFGLSDATTGDSEGYCLEGCEFGAPDASKCQGSAQRMCIAFSPDVSAAGTLQGGCIPVCDSDSDCDSGAFCNLYLGMCVSEDFPGKEIGDECTPPADPANANPADEECGKGAWCLPVTSDKGFCTASCNVHPDTVVCGGLEPGPDAKAMCLFDPYIAYYTGVNSNINDEAWCYPLCNEDADCPADMECLDADVQDLTGKTGLCAAPNVTQDAGAPPNTDTDAGVPQAADAG